MSNIYLITVMIFMIIPQAFSSHEMLTAQVDKENDGRKRRNANIAVPKSSLISMEQPSASISWPEIEEKLRNKFIAEKKCYNLFWMIKILKAVCKDEVAFESFANDYFRVREREHLQYLMHCCKEVKEKEAEKDKELRKENKRLTYQETNPIIMEIIEKYTNWK